MIENLESKMAGLPLRAAPEEWRRQILGAADQASAAVVEGPWWRAWLRPERLALAAAWTVILTLRAIQSPPPDAGTPVTAADWRAHVEAEQIAVAQPFDQPPAPTEKTLPSRGALLLRRQPCFA